MKILYSVTGEGYGHAIRSKAILSALQKDHTVLVAAAGKSYPILSKFFNTVKIGCFHIIYRNNSMSFLTHLCVILKFPFLAVYNLKLIPVILKFKPDIIITDFEPFSCYLSKLFNKKCISIDNQHIINTKIEVPDNLWNKLILWFVVRICIPFADYYFVTTFFYPENKKNNTFLFPPVNRQEIIESKPEQGDYFLVYQTSNSNKKLLSILAQLNHKFIVYGFNENTVMNNITLKKFDEKEFIKDLSCCNSVIANGGFLVIGEALHFKKPILSVPVKRQFEQIINAYYLEKLGYGKYCKELSKENLQDFISHLDYYKNNLKKYIPEDNSKIINKLNEVIDLIGKGQTI